MLGPISLPHYRPKIVYEPPAHSQISLVVRSPLARILTKW
jgi:hypothetical protein